MKKRFVLFLSLILIVNFIFIVSSQADIEEKINDLTNKVDNVTNTVDSFKYLNKTEKDKYLSEEWGKILLKNPVLSAVNNTFVFLNPLFFILFAYNYGFSLTLFFIITLWLFFLAYFNRILKDFSGLSKGVALIASLIAVVILSHVKLFLFITNFLFNLIFFQEGIFINILSLGMYIFIMFFLFALIKYFGKGARQRREKLKKEENEFKQKLSDVEREAFSKSIKHIEDSLEE